MALSDRLPAAHRGRVALDEWEKQQALSDDGQRIVENFRKCVDWGDVSVSDLGDFAERLGRVSSPTLGEDDLKILDSPTPLYCRGKEIPGSGSVPLSRVVLFKSLLKHNVKGGTNIAADDRRLARYERLLDRGLITPRHLRRDAPLRGKRPMAWMTPSEDIAEGLKGAYTATAPTGFNQADALRDLLGFRFFAKKGTTIVELSVSPGGAGTLHHPTVLDALDNPAFLPWRNADGWGRTDDLSRSRGTPGAREAVSYPIPATSVVQIKSRGKLSKAPGRLS